MSVKVLMMGMAGEPGSARATDPPGYAETLCMANTFIPLFWLLPFREQDMHLQSVRGGGQRYPVLYARREAMLARLDSCIQPVCELLGGRVVQLIQQWMSWLAGCKHTWLMLETWDLWRVFADPQGLQHQITDQFEALERLIATHHLGDEQCAALLEPANLLLPGCDSFCLDDISLTGYGWRAH